MWTPGPFETRADARDATTSPTRSVVAAERQDEHLRDFNYADALVDLDPRGLSRATSCTTSTCARSTSKVRKSIAVRAGVLRRRLGALLRADDDRGGLRPAAITRSSSDSSPKRWSASPASSSASGCTPRTGRWSRACGSSATRRSWRKRARGARPSAARSIRPIWSTRAGKLMLLKLRQDWQAAAGRQVLAARVPRHAARPRHGAVLAAPAADARRRRRRRRAGVSDRSADAPLRIPVRRVRAPLRGDPEVLGSADRRLPEVRRPGQQAALVAGDSVQGIGLVHHRLRARREDRIGDAGSGKSDAKRRIKSASAKADERRPRAKSETKSEQERTQGRSQERLARPSRKSRRHGRAATATEAESLA